MTEFEKFLKKIIEESPQEKVPEKVEPTHEPKRKEFIECSPDKVWKMKLTKSSLNKYIKWTTSRYNSLRKVDVVKEAYEILKNGGVWNLSWKDPESLEGKTWRGVESLGGKERVEILRETSVYHAGTFCEGSLMSGSHYYVDGKKKTLSIGWCDDYENFREDERIEFYIKKEE